jgi:hypothetical protein
MAAVRMSWAGGYRVWKIGVSNNSAFENVGLTLWGLEFCGDQSGRLVEGWSVVDSKLRGKRAVGCQAGCYCVKQRDVTSQGIQRELTLYRRM